ncbi:hypothetical protein EBR57_07445 [bacterium]|nr:hypothetical protein [bacterium]
MGVNKWVVGGVAVIIVVAGTYLWKSSPTQLRLDVSVREVPMHPLADRMIECRIRIPTTSETLTDYSIMLVPMAPDIEVTVPACPPLGGGKAHWLSVFLRTPANRTQSVQVQLVSGRRVIGVSEPVMIKALQ